MARGITTRTGQRLTRFDRGRVSWARVTRLNLKATYFSDFTQSSSSKEKKLTVPGEPEYAYCGGGIVLGEFEHSDCGLCLV